MRIHAIKAPTMPIALKLTRETYGDDAIVLDTEETPEGAIVRVGVDVAPTAPRESDANAEGDTTGESATPKPKQQPIFDNSVDRAAEALSWHGAPPLVSRSLLLAVEQSPDMDVEEALAEALERMFRFGRPENLATPLALIGPPGSGKTATLAKLAAARCLAGGEVSIVNGDLETAGAEGRINAFAAALGTEPRPATNEAEIAAALVGAGPDAISLIDTPGRAPADPDDIEDTRDIVEAAGHGVLVLSAAISPAEAGELAECFAAAGARSLIMTQLDIARRIGALLAAADAGDLEIAAVSLGRKVGDGLSPLTPKSLARLIMAPPPMPAKVQPRAPSRPFAAYAEAENVSEAATEDGEGEPAENDIAAVAAALVADAPEPEDDVYVPLNPELHESGPPDDAPDELDRETDGLKAAEDTEGDKNAIAGAAA